MAKRKKTAAPSQAAPAASAPEREAGSRRKRNLARHSTILMVFTGVAIVAIFVGRWMIAITGGYFGCFVQHDASADQAAANMTGLTLSEEESARLLPLQREWDLFTSSRLRDEVTVEAEDGTVLHGYLFDEGSSVTAVVLPRFHQDGTADFLPGAGLHGLTGCNLLLPDPRAHGKSGGDYFGFGYLEQRDLAVWLAWAEEALGEQTFILWGEGTGANTILFAAASGLLPDSVAMAVAESPYASLHQLAVTNIWKWYQVPAFPFLYPIEWKLAGSGAGYSVDDADLASALAGSGADLFVLFLQSVQDDYIIPDWSRAVYDAYPGPKEQIAGGQSHGTVYAACRDEIEARISAQLAE